MIGLYLTLMAVALIVSAFLCAIEVAFLAVQKSRVKHLVSTGVAGGAEVERIALRPDRLLATTLFSNNVVQTAAAALGTVAAVTLLGEKAGLLAATGGIALLTLLFAEAVPKTFAARHAEGLALFFARPFRILEGLLYPVVSLISWLTARLSGGELAAPRYTLSEEEIRSMITVGQEEGAVEEEAARMMHKVLEFRNRHTSEVMTPRPEVVGVELGTPLSEFLTIFAQHPHSRFPVYRDSLDNVVGMLTIKDVLAAQGTLAAEAPIDGLVRPVSFFPESKPLGQLLTGMQDAGSPMAAIVDEYGGIAGIVTMEDLVEEIVGEVRDELGGAGEWEAIDESTFQVDGGLRVEEANEELGLSLPEGDYQTVAGLFLARAGHIPREGEHIHFGGWKLVVTQMRGMKIEKVLITRE